MSWLLGAVFFVPTLTFPPSVTIVAPFFANRLFDGLARRLEALCDPNSSTLRSPLGLTAHG